MDKPTEQQSTSAALAPQDEVIAQPAAMQRHRSAAILAELRALSTEIHKSVELHNEKSKVATPASSKQLKSSRAHQDPVVSAAVAAANHSASRERQSTAAAAAPSPSEQNAFPAAAQSSATTKSQGNSSNDRRANFLDEVNRVAAELLKVRQRMQHPSTTTGSCPTTGNTKTYSLPATSNNNDVVETSAAVARSGADTPSSGRDHVRSHHTRTSNTATQITAAASTSAGSSSFTNSDFEREEQKESLKVVLPPLSNLAPSCPDSGGQELSGKLSKDPVAASPHSPIISEGGTLRGTVPLLPHPGSPLSNSTAGTAHHSAAATSQQLFASSPLDLSRSGKANGPTLDQPTSTTATGTNNRRVQLPVDNDDGYVGQTPKHNGASAHSTADGSTPTATDDDVAYSSNRADPTGTNVTDVYDGEDDGESSIDSKGAAAVVVGEVTDADRKQRPQPKLLDSSALAPVPRSPVRSSPATPPPQVPANRLPPSSGENLSPSPNRKVLYWDEEEEEAATRSNTTTNASKEISPTARQHSADASRHVEDSAEGANRSPSHRDIDLGVVDVTGGSSSKRKPTKGGPHDSSSAKKSSASKSRSRAQAVLSDPDSARFIHEVEVHEEGEEEEEGEEIDGVGHGRYYSRGGPRRLHYDEEGEEEEEEEEHTDADYRHPGNAFRRYEADHSHASHEEEEHEEGEDEYSEAVEAQYQELIQQHFTDEEVYVIHRFHDLQPRVMVAASASENGTMSAEDEEVLYEFSDLQGVVEQLGLHERLRRLREEARRLAKRGSTASHSLQHEDDRDDEAHDGEEFVVRGHGTFDPLGTIQPFSRDVNHQQLHHAAEEEEEEPEEEEDEEDCVVDGVRTTVLFRSVDADRYDFLANVGRWTYETDNEHHKKLAATVQALQVEHQRQELKAMDAQRSAMAAKAALSQAMGTSGRSSKSTTPLYGSRHQHLQGSQQQQPSPSPNSATDATNASPPTPASSPLVAELEANVKSTAEQLSIEDKRLAAIKEALGYLSNPEALSGALLKREDAAHEEQLRSIKKQYRKALDEALTAKLRDRLAAAGFITEGAALSAPATPSPAIGKTSEAIVGPSPSAPKDKDQSFVLSDALLEEARPRCLCPSFPLGGGITSNQHEDLTGLYRYYAEKYTLLKANAAEVEAENKASSSQYNHRRKSSVAGTTSHASYADNDLLLSIPNAASITGFMGGSDATNDHLFDESTSAAVSPLQTSLLGGRGRPSTTTTSPSNAAATAATPTAPLLPSAPAAPLIRKDMIDNRSLVECEVAFMKLSSVPSASAAEASVGNKHTGTQQLKSAALAELLKVSAALAMDDEGGAEDATANNKEPTTTAEQARLAKAFPSLPWAVMPSSNEDLKLWADKKALLAGGASTSPSSGAASPHGVTLVSYPLQAAPTVIPMSVSVQRNVVFDAKETKLRRKQAFKRQHKLTQWMAQQQVAMARQLELLMERALEKRAAEANPSMSEGTATATTKVSASPEHSRPSSTKQSPAKGATVATSSGLPRAPSFTSTSAHQSRISSPMIKAAAEAAAASGYRNANAALAAALAVPQLSPNQLTLNADLESTVVLSSATIPAGSAQLGSGSATGFNSIAAAATALSTFELQVRMDPYRTGFEDDRELPITPGTVIADRYQIIDLLGQATFSRAVRCVDLQQRYIYNSETSEYTVRQLAVPDAPLTRMDGALEEEEPPVPTDSDEDTDSSDDATSNSDGGSEDEDADATPNTSAILASSGATEQAKKGDKKRLDALLASAGYGVLPATTTPESKSKKKRTRKVKRVLPEGYTGTRSIETYVHVCLKIINNSKEFFDQSLDEIRLLHLLNSRGNPDTQNFVRMYNFFYHREHTFIVTELLSTNLYDYGKYIRDRGLPHYYTITRLRKIAKQVLTSLAFVHSLNLVHCDLKPENILFVSHSRCEVKVIDFGSSCFLSDHLSSYVQSRSYRAPEVILGADYDGRIDVWSLGALLVELATQQVLFQSDTAAEMLARIVAVCGKPLPRSLLYEGRTTANFIDRFGCIYEVGEKGNDAGAEDCYYLYTPVHAAPLKSDPRVLKPAATHAGGEGEVAVTIAATELAARREGTKALAAAVSKETNSVADSEGGLKALSSRVTMGGAFPVEPYSLLRAKLANEGYDPSSLFADFIIQCLDLDHKRRPTSEVLLKHPFLAEVDADEDVTYHSHAAVADEALDHHESEEDEASDDEEAAEEEHYEDDDVEEEEEEYYSTNHDDIEGNNDVSRELLYTQNGHGSPSTDDEG